ncbi:MAG: GNAT family N-acetyltransferase [Bacteroidetes bacterium]|nr:MAG: GNAT family N-acetyltransferase [Bacteroidota bacterium]TAE62123.1 MAG: GNAT family N-acetyltransferase [Bacteroidota bacterium]
MITILPAQLQHTAAMMELIQELAIYEKEPEAVTVSLEHFQESGFGKNPVWLGWVACNTDNEVVGMAICYIRYSTWKGQRLYLEDLLVTESHRGKGIGKLLLDEVIQYAQEQQYTGVAWQVLDWNEPAINFYKKYPVVFDAAWVNCSINF